MKKLKTYKIWALAWGIALWSTACTELGPPVSFKDTTALQDTTYVDPDLPTGIHKSVLIEEFTGATCNNCPRGAGTVKDILNNHPDSVVAIAIHNDNPLAQPHAGAEDLRTAEGIQISQRLGGSAAIPSASVDRHKFQGTNQLVIYRSQWENGVATQLNQPPAVALSLQSDYNATERNLIVTAKIHYLRTVDTTTHLSIAITENGIISPQTMPDLSVKQDYEHNHILRGMVTPVFGTLTHATTEKGRVVEKQFSITLPPNWVASNCYVVGFVHFIGDSDEVLQVTEVAVE